MKARSSRTRSRNHAAPPARRHSRRRRRRRIFGIAIAAVVAAVLVWAALPAVSVPSRAKRNIAYNRTYGWLLTPEQVAIRNEALGAIPAPCCDEYSIATCCCPCNLAKSVWGLANRLIVERGAGVATVRREVRTWLAAINPGGAAGDACRRGRCDLPFHEDGCGGMDESRVS